MIGRLAPTRYGGLSDIGVPSLIRPQIGRLGTGGALPAAVAGLMAPAAGAGGGSGGGLGGGSGGGSGAGGGAGTGGGLSGEGGSVNLPGWLGSIMNPFIPPVVPSEPDTGAPGNGPGVLDRPPQPAAGGGAGGGDIDAPTGINPMEQPELDRTWAEFIEDYPEYANIPVSARAELLDWIKEFLGGPTEGSPGGGTNDSAPVGITGGYDPFAGRDLRGSPGTWTPPGSPGRSTVRGTTGAIYALNDLFDSPLGQELFGSDAGGPRFPALLPD